MKAYKQLISIVLVLICVIQQAYSAAAHTTTRERQERDISAADFLEKRIIDFLETITESPLLRKQEIDKFFGDLKTFAYLYLDELTYLERVRCFAANFLGYLKEEELKIKFDTIFETQEGRLANLITHLIKKIVALKDKAAVKEKPFDKAAAVEEKLDNLWRLAGRLLETVAYLEKILVTNTEKDKMAETKVTIELNTKELIADFLQLLELVSKKKEILDKLLDLITVMTTILNEHNMAETKVTIEFNMQLLDPKLIIDKRRIPKEHILAEHRVVDLEEKLKPCLRSIFEI